MKKIFLISISVLEGSGRGTASLIILSVFLAISGNAISAATIEQLKEQKENSRMLLLEKLEKGEKLSGAEIRSGLSPSYGTDDFITDFELPEIPEFPGHPDIFINPPHIFVIPDHFEFDEESMRELKENLSRSIEELKEEIESVIHSEEMINFHREMKEWGEEIRREVEKAMQEMKTEKEITLKIEGVRS
jgi:hypothetical protein